MPPRLPGAIKFLQPFLAFVLSTLRAPKSAEGYASIGGGSPLRSITQDQVGCREGGGRWGAYKSVPHRALPTNVWEAPPSLAI